MSSFNPIYSDQSKFYLTLAHFSPFNFWTEDTNHGCFPERDYDIKDRPKFVVDMTTGDRYLNEPLFLTSLKCLGIALISIPFYSIIAPKNICDIIWKAKNQPDERLAHTISRIVLTPFVIIGIFTSALYGVVNPRDGRKLIASLERFWAHRSVIADCFQPSSDHHKRKDIVNPPPFNVQLGIYAH